jgi:hypothetical protein
MVGVEGVYDRKGARVVVKRVGLSRLVQRDRELNKALASIKRSRKIAGMEGLEVWINPIGAQKRQS